MKKAALLILFLILLLVGTTFVLKNQTEKVFFAPRPTTVKESVKLNEIEAGKKKPDVEIIAENLQIPWEIVFLPDGSMLVSERPGNLLKIDQETKLIQKIEGVAHIGEGGLQGMALHPNFVENSWVYLYFTTRSHSGLTNRVERYRLENDLLSNKTVILSGIAGAQFHDGGRMEFGPDGYLYITTGDAGNKPSAQDTSSLNGKILRIKNDGTIPEDNPFGNAVFSYGHRNPQGLAWDQNSRLWITEHGPSGFESGFDEVNLIEKGKNYGWPEIQGDEAKTGMISPVIQSGADDTWAPAGMVYWKGSFFFAGLRGESLYEAKLTDKDTLSLTAHFRKEYGRLRAVVLSPDGYLYLTTSNTDGRGSKKAGDDKIIRINPEIFREI